MQWRAADGRAVRPRFLAPNLHHTSRAANENGA